MKDARSLAILPKTVLSPPFVLIVERLGKYRSYLCYVVHSYDMVLTSEGTTNPNVPILRNFEGLAVTVVKKDTPPVNALPSPKKRVLTAVKKGISLLPFV